MKVCSLLVVLFLACLPLSCYALSSPSDAMHDTIKKQSDSYFNDLRFEIHKTTSEIGQKFKEALKTVLIWAVEVGTVAAIGWCFTFLVDKQSAKMIKLLLVIGLITEVIKFLTKAINWYEVNTVSLIVTFLA